MRAIHTIVAVAGLISCHLLAPYSPADSSVTTGPLDLGPTDVGPRPDLTEPLDSGPPDFGPDLIANTPTQLYRSVGTNGDDLNTSSHTVEISGDTATFSGSMPNNVGVGDVLKYQDGASSHLAFIHGRVSNAVYTVKGAGGDTAPQGVKAGTPVGVYRAYTGLADWEELAENENISIDFDNSTDLVADNTVMNVACYADGVDSPGMFIDDWTTGIDNYIRIYTPFLPTEVGTSQRHNGTPQTGFKVLRETRTATDSTASTIWLRSTAACVRIEGLVIQNANYEREVIRINNGLDIRISNNIIFGDGVNTSRGIRVYSSGAAVLRIWNNIVFDVGQDESGGAISTADTAYLFNNTVANTIAGFGFRCEGTCIAKNNVVSKAARDAYYGIFQSGSDFNASSDGTSTGGSNDRINQTFTFVSESAGDFHLAAGDTGASGYGIDLSNDSLLPIHLDIDRQTRSAPWDMGADEK